MPTTDKHLRHYWSVLCKSIVVDQFTNNMVLGEVLEEIRYQVPLADKEKLDEAMRKGEAVLPFEAFLGSYMEADEPNSNLPASFEYVLPNGEVVKMADVSLHFGGNKRGRNITRIQGLKISGSGKYIFRVLTNANVDPEILAEIPLFVGIDYV